MNELPIPNFEQPADENFYEIASGTDSRVFRWNRESVLKYYTESDVLKDDLLVYAAATNRVARHLDVHPIDISIGLLKLSVIPMDQVTTFQTPTRAVPVSQSRYVRGIELRHLRKFKDNLTEQLETGTSDEERNALVRFGRAFRSGSADNDQLLNGLMWAALALQTEMKRILGISYEGPGENNIRVSAPLPGEYVLNITDLAPFIVEFARNLPQRNRR